MKALIDTHTVVWATDDPSRLSQTAGTVLQDPAVERYLSVGTIWELSIKVGLGKMTISKPYRQWMEQTIVDLDLRLLPITIPHAEAQANLPHHHRDPFDRLLIAQAIVEGMPIVSVDAAIDRYGVARIW
jgi:PIN domain nuclease of toxin-antitoxin system